MARTPMVTRTIKSTSAKVLCLNLNTKEPFETEVILSGTYKDNQSVDKAVHKLIDTEDVKAVHVSSFTEQEELYGMTEQEFIEHAKILDKETRKILELETENDETEE